MAMKNNLRIVFAYCLRDSWIAPIAGDLYKASKTLGNELFVVAAGRECYLDEKCYVNLDSLESNYYMSRVFNSLQYEDIDLTELVDLEYEHLKCVFDKEKESKDEIQRRLHLWFTEAVVILKIIQPDVVIVWNGLLSKYAVYAMAAKQLHIPIYYAEKGMLPNSWYVDPKGINALSTIAEKIIDFEIAKSDIDNWKLKFNKINEEGDSAWEQPERKEINVIKKDLGTNANQKIVFFPGQVDSDSNIVLFSENFRNCLEALKWLVEGLPREEYFILAKPHPKGGLSEEDFKKIIGDKGRALPEINVIDAIELADCIVSINSTVTFEAAIRAKPVLLLGRGVLSNKDFVSKYEPGKNAHLQVMECIKKYNERKDNFSQEALSFAVYLNSVYYTYRGDYPKTLNLLKRWTKDLDASKEKVFNVEEIAAFFQKVSFEDVGNWFFQRVSVEDIKNWLKGEILFKALFRKVKDKFIH